MYNRYVPPQQSYAPVPPPDAPPRLSEEKYIRGREDAQGFRDKTDQNFPPQDGFGGLPLGKLTGFLDKDKSGPIASLFSALRLETLDTGELLLLLILLLILTEGDDLELVITLGLVLLLGLGDQSKKDPDAQSRPDRGACEADGPPHP